MNSKNSNLAIVAALLGFLGVALGAFGAHGLKELLEAAGQSRNWEKAVLYQLVHAVALLALVTRQPGAWSTRAGWCWVAGIIGFSGSLYWIALGGPVKLLWPVTPLGGLALLAGWSATAWAAFRREIG